MMKKMLLTLLTISSLNAKILECTYTIDDYNGVKTLSKPFRETFMVDKENIFFTAGDVVSVLKRVKPENKYMFSNEDGTLIVEFYNFRKGFRVEAQGHKYWFQKCVSLD